MKNKIFCKFCGRKTNADFCCDDHEQQYTLIMNAVDNEKARLKAVKREREENMNALPLSEQRKIMRALSYKPQLNNAAWEQK